MNSYQNMINTKEMSHEEWLQTRRIGIGGSDVSSILGFNPYKTALDVYYEKISEEVIETPMNAKMRAGVMLEDVVADWFVIETGLKVQRDNKIRIHKEIPFLIGNIDRLIIGNNGDGPGVLEIKTTSGFVAKNWEDGDVPLNYYAQLQHYLSVTGYKYGYFAVLVDGWDFRLFREERDDEFINKMNQRLIDFWVKVEKQIPPEPINESDIKKLYPKHTELKTVEATKETFQVYKDLLDVRKQIKELEAAELELADTLKLVMKDAEALEYEGQKIITWKATKDRNKFETKLFQKDHPDLYSTYSVTVPGSRTFLVKEIK